MVLLSGSVIYIYICVSSIHAGTTYDTDNLRSRQSYRQATGIRQLLAQQFERTWRGGGGEVVVVEYSGTEG